MSSALTEPVIVFIEPRGYKHFAVLRGVQGDRAYLADPSRRNMRQPMYAFLHDWVRDGGTGIIFVVEPKAGHSPGKSPRAFRVIAPSGQPEVITARELLTIGAPLLRPPQPSR